MNEVLSTVADRYVDLIGAIQSIGLVQAFNPFARTDISGLIVSEIDGIKVMRAWWVQGPTMEARFVTEVTPGHVARTWTWEIHGIEGVAPAWEGDTRTAGQELNTLRDNAAAVTDALDADDIGMDGLVFRSWPCEWADEPAHIEFGEPGNGFVCAYAVITKRVMTMRDRN